MDSGFCSRLGGVYAGSSDGRTLDSEFWILDFRGGGMPGQAIMAGRVVTRQQPSRYARSCKTIHAVPPAGNVLRDTRDTQAGRWHAARGTGPGAHAARSMAHSSCSVRVAAASSLHSSRRCVAAVGACP